MMHYLGIADANPEIPAMPRVIRLGNGPVIRPEMDERMGANVNGPSVIRVPAWVKHPLGRYYLYFSHHQGAYIRMAYADAIAGPYRIYSPGVLNLEETPFLEHIASPEVVVDHDRRRFLMYYHGAGCRWENPLPHVQVTCLAVSADGCKFASLRECLAESYLRVFRHKGWIYGLTGGPYRRWNRSRSVNERFEEGPVLEIAGENFSDLGTALAPAPRPARVFRMRHVAFHRKGHRMWIYYSNIGDCPERIKRTWIDLREDWEKWRGAPCEEILRPQEEWEGALAPLVPSRPSSAHSAVNELRDPFILEDEGRDFLFYSVAGEQGIGVAEMAVRSRPSRRGRRPGEWSGHFATGL